MRVLHQPVMVSEVINFLKPKAGGVYVDATVGGGGHSEKIKIQNPKSKIIAIDWDREAIEAAKEKLAKYTNIIYIHDNFANLKKHVKSKVDGVLFDLGVSSYQIDTPERGFSLRLDGPLDMRMNSSHGITAAELINSLKADQLEKIIREFGEERFAQRISKAIIRARPIFRTGELAEIVRRAVPGWRKRESVARVFQAFRIAVNQELENLKSGLKAAIDLLKIGGRIVVISYHSLEDRIVKQTFRSERRLKILTLKPVQPPEKELVLNPRARSAKLRAAARC